MNTLTTDPADTPASLFIDGFAAGSELSRQSAFAAWLRFSVYHFAGQRCGAIQELRDREERQGFNRGIELGRLYAGKPADPKAMSASEHNRFEKGRWTP